MTWRDKYVGSADVDPQTLAENPRNWRLHTQNQRRAMRQVLDRIGYVQPIIVRAGTNTILDGHLRHEMAINDGQPTIPVWYVDVDDAEESVVLAALDRTTEMAETDGEALSVLTASVRMDLGAHAGPELWELLGAQRPEPVRPTYGTDTVDERRTNEGMLEAYTTTDARQIMLILTADQHATISARFDQIAADQELESRTAVLVWLCQEDENEHGPGTE